jgi:cyclopropane fatty-acyl-phospholipid synthase-like methyltransferase
VTDQGRATPSGEERADWLFELRRENERQEDALETYDSYWTETDDAHLSSVDRFLSMLPVGGSVLDAACGIGRYVGPVLASGRSVTAVDASARHLEAVRTSFPGAATEKLDLQDLPFRDRFDGVMCVDAMEFVPSEDWPRVLARFREALHQKGWLYLTVELVPAEQIRSSNEAARRAGLPVVDGEVMWEMTDRSPGYYHFYPSLQQVRVWMTAAGFRILDEVEGPWVDGEYAYHHVLARTSSEVEPR